MKFSPQTKPFMANSMGWFNVLYLVVLVALIGPSSSIKAQTCQATIPNFNTIPTGVQTGCTGTSFTFMTRIDHVTGFNLVYPNGTMTWYPHNGAYSANFNSISIAYQAGWNSAQFEIRAVSCGPAAAISSRYFYLTTRAATAITTQPLNTVVCPGNRATIGVVASGSGLTYQWRQNGVNLANNLNIAGSNNATLTITSVSNTDLGSYSCVIGSSSCPNYAAVTTTNAALSFAAVASVTPASTTVCTGQSSVFTCSINTSYLWSNGATTRAITPTAAGIYTVTATTSGGCTSTASAELIVTSLQASIVQSPTSQTVCAGSPASFSVVATGANAYQWMFNGAVIPGATSSSYNIGSASMNDLGAYTVSVTGCGNTVTSTPANLVVNGFTLQPTSQVLACQASVPVRFTVQASTVPTSYLWRLNGNNLTNNAVYSGVNSATLTVSSGTPAEFGVYDCVITLGCGNVTSSTATLSGILTGAQLNLSLNNNLTDASGNARNGTGTVTYVADRNGVASSAVSLNGTAAQYVTVPAANYFGNGNFTVATWVKIDAYTLYARLFDFGNGPANNNVVAYINASGNINVTYFNGTTGSSTLATPATVPLNTWTHFAWVQSGLDAKLYINGSLVANQVNMVQTFPNMSRSICYIGASNWTSDPKFTGAFDDFVIMGRALNANEISVISGGVPVTQQPVSTFSCASQPVTLSITAPTALTYQWQFNGVNIPNATASTYTANGTTASYGVYRVSLTSACGSGFSNNATVSAGTIQDITTSLYAHYRMNGNTLDASGNNRTATGVTPTYTTDRAGTTGMACNFTGTQYLSLPAAPFMLNTAAKTYSVWFKTTATNVPIVGLARAAVNGVNQGFFCYMHVNNNGKLDGGTYNGGFRTVTPSTASVNDGQWHHATWTNNGANTQSIYLDGAIIGSATDGSSLAAGNMYFGQAQVSGYPNFVGAGTNAWVGFNGQLDDARIYDRNLTAAQITALYQEAIVNFAQTTASTCVGQSLTLAPQIYSGGSSSYAWTFNGNNATNGNGISGVNTNTLNITNAASGNAGAYNLQITSNSCNTFSGTPVTVTIGNAPSITQQPQNRTICLGGNTTFTVIATNVTSYQWRRNGADINGATNATLSITNAQSANVGSYDVLMTSACGTLTSNTVTLALSASAPSITSANTTITCAQNSVSLTATAGTTYRWSNNQTTQAINVTAAGTYTVTVTDASSCTGTSAVTVTANTTAPAVSITAPATITCLAPQVTLTASGATSYAWTGGPTTATRTVTAAGNYTVVGTSANGCTGSASVSVTSNATIPPVTIATPATITCVVTQVTLTANGATSYAWTGGPTTATRTVTAAGTYTVVGTNASGCTASASVSVTANTLAPAVSIAPPATITCASPQITLTATGANAYAWTGGPTTATRVVTAAGTYSVVGTGANGCTASSVVTVTSNTVAPPTAAASVNQSATNANFPAVITIAGYNPNLHSYRLLNFTTNALVTNMNGPTVTNTSGGVFKVEITSLANGCVSYSNRIKVIFDANFGLVIGTVSIPGTVNRPAGGKVVSEDFGTNATPVGVFYDMHVYPNPASDYLNINYEFEQETEAQFSLYSADGRMVWEQKTSAASNLLQVNVTDIPSGQYFLRMSSQLLTKTILVQVVK